MKEVVGIVGRKLGMSSFPQASGQLVGVTLVEVLPNRVTTVKTLERDGYHAVQVTTGKASRRLNKAEAGHFARQNIEPGRGLWEFRMTAEQIAGCTQAMESETDFAWSIDDLKVGQSVDVRSVSIGKGFQGAMKRWNFSGQRASHGNSLSHRAIGSTGQCQQPGRVFKGKKMAARMGGQAIYIRSLKVLHIDSEQQILFIQGSLPGASGVDVIIRPEGV